MTGLFKNWRSWGLRKQLVVFLGGWTSIFMVVAISVVVAVILSLVDQGSTLARDVVVTQAKSNLASVSHSNSALLETSLLRYQKSLLIVVNALQDLLDNSTRLPLAFSPAYFDFNHSTLPGNFLDPRCGCMQSDTTSVYYIPESHPSNISALMTSAIADNINRTQLIDIYLTQIYRMNPDVLLLLFGMEEGPVYRRFPGKTVDETRTYTPVTRPWYRSAANSPTTPVWSSPFLDAFGKGWVVSVSRSVHRSNTSSAFVGVASVNILTTSIRRFVLDLEVPAAGSATLVFRDGVIVADARFNQSGSVTKSIFETIVNSDGSTAISQSLWNTIRSVSSQGLYEIDINGAKHFLTANAILDGTFLLLTVAQESVIVASATAVREDIEITRNDLFMILFLVSFATFLGVLVCVVILSYHISRPVAEMQDVADSIIKNSADKSTLFSDLHLNPLPKQSQRCTNEASQLQNTFWSLILHMKEEEGRKTNRDLHPPNPFYDNPAWQVWKPGWTPEMLHPPQGVEASAPVGVHDVSIRPLSTSILPPGYDSTL
eukprot:ANDGO_00908.mRNA.1 cache domain protein